ncbi:YheC/YheD family endospore coat-associated protein [Metabacillus malikii]|uniref:ATP-grasp domain-containing protein n=1 Tax=Metabacillus malikii TaxID=1504265 RepID=A0ABT9ZF27_9BACI|nr:YheC/YheD family protein [Metabacillus malikii]MDQ0230437.1 hypothetical protein [Metabacillus malikii]
MIKIKYHKSNINRFLNNQKTIQLSNKFLQKHNINTKELIVKFGLWSYRLIIELNNDLAEYEISIHDGLMFKIPESFSYEYKLVDDTLHIGPFMVYIAKKSFSHLTKKRLNQYKQRYDDSIFCGGLLLFCSSDSIDIEKQIVKGYYFNENKKQWTLGIFPYPDVVFKKIRIPKEQQANLLQATNNKLFNTNSFSKYDLWKVCSIDSRMREYLPYTKLYKSYEDLAEMLQLFDSVYFKPVYGMQGNGIFVVKKEANGYVIKKAKNDQITCKSIDDVNVYLDQLLESKKYLIQQAVPTVYRDKQFDFRFYLQKDYQQQWVCQGIIGRVAQKDSIITNLKHIAHLTDGVKAIKIAYKVDDEQAKAILQKSIEICKNVCQTLDEKLGHYGDVALDVIIDGHYKPWVLEVNNMYGKKSLQVLKEKELINKLNSTPFEYAKSLAGF